jgi:Fic family protein
VRLSPRLDSPEVRRYIDRANARYAHWDELRHRPTPPGLSPEDAWQLVKLARQPRRVLPLQDEQGVPFSYWLSPAALQTLHVIDRWGGSSLAAIDGAAASSLEPLREQVIVSSLMEEAIATSQIEGAATTRRVAKEMLRTNRRPRDRSEQMIVNSYETIQLLRDRKDRPLSVDLLFEIQERMTRDALDDRTAAGRFRTREDDVAVVDVGTHAVLFTPPAAERLPERVAKLVEFVNDSDEWMHPLVRAAILHFWLAYEHPFVDGNGRTARALFYWFMLKNGYWLFEFLTVSRAIAASRTQYYRSFLHSERDDGDLTYSLTYQLAATQRAFGDLRDYLHRKQAEQAQLARTLRAVPDLNHRQRELLDHALRHPEQTYTFKSHEISQGITYVTARNDLLDLAARGLLSETRQGRQRAFFAAEDLARRLRSPGRSSA